jgi:DNA-binding transcriptional ArsR family regulator
MFFMSVKEDLLLNPARMRIVLAMVGREMTAQQLAAELPDVPQATLYRHINTLAQAGILEVVHERRVRNTLEKFYALRSTDLTIKPEELAGASPQEHISLFTHFLGLLLGYFARYACQGSIDFARDFSGYRLVPLNLSQDEMQRFAASFNEALLPFIHNELTPERQRRILATVFLPDVAPAGATGSGVESTTK